MKKFAALFLALTMTFSMVGCTDAWVKVALADLPVLLQMALNIGSLVSTLHDGQQIGESETQAIQKISAEASKDLNLLSTLYDQYETNPTASGLQKIQSTISDINVNLPALMQAAHISDPTLASRVSAGVNLILATVASFAALMPHSPGFAVSVQAKKAVPHAVDLKKNWNQSVCGITGKPGIDAALATCSVK